MRVITDEYGVTWTVMAHDPASQLVNELRRKGFDIVTLPRYTLRTGLIPEEPTLAPDFLLNVRLQDCLLTLEDKKAPVWH